MMRKLMIIIILFSCGCSGVTYKNRNGDEIRSGQFGFTKRMEEAVADMLNSTKPQHYSRKKIENPAEALVVMTLDKRDREEKRRRNDNSENIELSSPTDEAFDETKTSSVNADSADNDLPTNKTLVEITKYLSGYGWYGGGGYGNFADGNFQGNQDKWPALVRFENPNDFTMRAEIIGPTRMSLVLPPGTDDRDVELRHGKYIVKMYNMNRGGRPFAKDEKFNTRGQPKTIKGVRYTNIVALNGY